MSLFGLIEIKGLIKGKLHAHIRYYKYFVILNLLYCIVIKVLVFIKGMDLSSFENSHSGI
jgi:hypothetical protein